MDFCCILCGNHHYRVLYASSIDPQTLGNALYLSTGRPVAAHGQIVKCSNCGMVCTFPQDDEKRLATAYQSLSDPEYLAERQARVINATRHLKFLYRFNHTPGTLLDVGCSTGFFLSIAQRHGWQVVGIEPSRWASQLARTEYGIETIYEGFLEETNVREAPFDVVTMWDVLEHVPNPVSAVATVMRILKPNGTLFMNLPNIESMTARLLGPRWMLLLREHLWYFSPRTIRILFEQTGLEVLSIVPNRVTFSMRGIFTRLLQHKFLGQRSALKTLGNNSFVVKRMFTFGMGEMLIAAKFLTK